jgi:hypothetical protein
LIKFFYNTLYLSFFSKIIQLLTGLGILIFILRYLTVEEQGIYYAITALFSLYFIVDLGFNSAIVSFLGHLRKKIKFNNNYFLGKKSELIKLIKFAVFCRKWIFRTIIILMILYILIGHIILSNNQNIPEYVFKIWILLIPFLLVNFFFIFLTVFYESLGLMNEIYICRILTFIISSSAFCLSLYFGLGVNFE